MHNLFYRPKQAVLFLYTVALLAGCSKGSGPEPVPPTQLSILVSNPAASTRIWLAGASGLDGTWTQLHGSQLQGTALQSTQRYTLPIDDSSGRYRLAFICNWGEIAHLTLLYSTVTELPEPKFNCGNPAVVEGTHIISGAVNPDARTTIALMGTNSFVEYYPDDERYELFASTGEQRLLALQLQGPNSLRNWAERLILRSLSVTGNVNLNLDFSQSIPTERHTVVAENVGTDSLLQEVRFHHPNNASQIFDPVVGKLWWGPGSYDYGGIPRAVQLPAEIHEAYTEAYIPGGGCGRNLTKYFKNPSDLRMILPERRMSGVAFSIVESTPALRLRASWDRYTEAQWYVATLRDTNHIWDAAITPGFLANQATSFEMPQLRNVAGWQTSWEMISRETLFGAVTALYSNRELQNTFNLMGDNMPGTSADGLEIRSAMCGGRI